MNRDKVTQIYDELDKMEEFTLVDNADLIDSKYLTLVLANCDTNLQKINRFTVEMGRATVSVRSQLRDKTNYFDARSDELVRTDPDIQRLTNFKERSNAVKEKLKETAREIRDLEVFLDDLKFLKSAIEGSSKRASEMIKSVKASFRANIDSIRALSLRPPESLDESIYTSVEHEEHGSLDDPILDSLIAK